MSLVSDLGNHWVNNNSGPETNNLTYNHSQARLRASGLQTQGHRDFVNTSLGEGQIHSAVRLLGLVLSVELVLPLLSLLPDGGVVEEDQDGAEGRHHVEEDGAQEPTV